MRRRSVIVGAGAVVAIVVLAIAFWPFQGDPISQAQTAPPPEPPPRWVIDAARGMANDYGHATSGYWGLLHDPELGDLTSSGPDDPSTKAYAIVLIGEFPGALAYMRLRPDSSPPPVPHFVVQIYTATATPKEAGVWGCGPSFDASQYPSLQPFSLE